MRGRNARVGDQNAGTISVQAPGCQAIAVGPERLRVTFRTRSGTCSSTVDRMADEGRRELLRAGVAGAMLALSRAAARASSVPRPEEGVMTEAAQTVQLSGLVGLQVNGFAGVDFGDADLTPERVLEAVAALEKTGVTRFLPTLITSSLEAFARSAHTVLAARHPAIAGIHMEGPYISPEDGFRGAHARPLVRDA